MLYGGNICKKKTNRIFKEQKKSTIKIQWHKHFPKEKMHNVLVITKHNENANENQKEISCPNKNVYYQRS